MAKVFISYSSQDKDLVYPYTQALANYYHQIIMDDSILTGGENMQKALMDALRNADGTVVFITKNSIHSKNVLSEIGIARSYLDNEINKKFLIPIVESNIEVPYIIQELHYLILDEVRVDKTVEQIDDAIKVFRK
ncbi:MAG: toll/interleukin-1 receptor domain-containing protein [Bacteroidota bacterium]|nr:toll/interleukin-1 receptor domain-containing protein [Bacteroidota bacterium]